MRRTLTGLALIVGAVAAIGSSNVDNNATVTLDGKLQRQDKTPAAEMRTLLFRVPDPIELLTQGIAFVESLGTVCLQDSPPPICKTFQFSKTDSMGAYRFMMKGSDTKGSLGQYSIFSFSGNLPTPGGAKTGPNFVTTLVFMTPMLAFPVFQMWEPGTLTIAGAAGRFTYAWEAYGMSHGSEPAGGYQVHYFGGGAEVWSESGMSGGGTDARALEDVMDGTFNVTASAKVESTSVAFGSQGIRFDGIAGAPPSRGKECSISDGNGMAVKLSPCTLTDGNFGNLFQAQPACPSEKKDCQANNWVSVDLGAVQAIGAVYLHGMSGGKMAAIETSDDGMTWTARATPSMGRFVSADLPMGTMARHVRVKMATGDALSALSELSVW